MNKILLFLLMMYSVCLYAGTEVKINGGSICFDTTISNNTKLMITDVGYKHYLDRLLFNAQYGKTDYQLAYDVITDKFNVGDRLINDRLTLMAGYRLFDIRNVGLYLTAGVQSYNQKEIKSFAQVGNKYKYDYEEADIINGIYGAEISIPVLLGGNIDGVLSLNAKTNGEDFTLGVSSGIMFFQLFKSDYITDNSVKNISKKKEIVKNKFGKISAEYAYDSYKHKILDINRDKNGSIVSWIEWAYLNYDEKRFKIEKTVKSADGKVIAFEKIDEAGKIEESISYAYDEQNRAISEIRKSGKGEITYWVEYYYKNEGKAITLTQKNEKGNVIYEKETDSLGVVVYTYSAEYNGNNKKLNEIQRDGKDTVIFWREYAYSDKGILIEYSDKNETGKKIKTVKYVYEADLKIREIEESQNGEIQEIKEYRYDNKNKLKAIIVKNSAESILKWNGYSYDGENREANDLTLFEINSNSLFKARSKIKLSVKDDAGDTLAFMPKNTVGLYSNNRITVPINGSVELNNVEKMFKNRNDIKFYSLKTTNIYNDPEILEPVAAIKGGTILENTWYSMDLDMYYVETESFSGWIKSGELAYLIKLPSANYYAVNKKGTFSYTYSKYDRKEYFASGTVISMDYFSPVENSLYSGIKGWFAKQDLIDLEIISEKVLYASKDGVIFQNDLSGDNYKRVKIGHSFNSFLQSKDSFFVISKDGEKGWIKKEFVTIVKPDIEKPIIEILQADLGNNNILSIKGNAYDDTDIKSVLVNGEEIKKKELSKNSANNGFSAMKGYAFDTSYYLVQKAENNIEIKVIDISGKESIKIFKYTPETKKTEELAVKIIKNLPNLEYKTIIEDENNDGVLTGGDDKFLIKISVKNNGEGTAKNVNLIAKESGIGNLYYNDEVSLSDIEPGQSATGVIEIKGDKNIKSGLAKFEISVEEGNGFNPFPVMLTFSVEPNYKPLVEVIDYAVEDTSKNGQIEPQEIFDIYVILKNNGEATGKNVVIEADGNADGIIATAENIVNLGDMEVGESQRVKFSFVVTAKYKGDGSLPLKIKVKDERSKFSSISDIRLALNSVIPTIKSIDFAKSEVKMKTTVQEKISVMSDVDEYISNITSINGGDNTKWGIVIGIEDYRKTVKVDFARRDAQVVKDYFEKVIGVPKSNMYYITDGSATLGEFKVLIENTLRNRVKKNDIVYFYFSGHGIPKNDGETYLLLNDSDPQNPAITAYAVKDIYTMLGKLESKDTYVFLDTCFSGGVARTNQVQSLLSGTRPGLLKVVDPAMQYNNLRVFTATDKDQLSNSYNDKGHGLFTYYMLKAMKGEADEDKDGKLSIDEMTKYIKENVSQKSRELFGETRYQNPVFKGNVETSKYIIE